MRLLQHPLALLVPAWAAVVAAVFSDDAYVLDYHHELLGYPRQDTTFFHPPQAASKASLLYTLSDKLVLGAVNPKDGTLVWRQSLVSASVDGTSTSFLCAGKNQDTVVSAVGHHVSAWDAASGRLVWQYTSSQGSVVAGLRVLELEHLHATATPRDVIALVAGASPKVLRLDAQTGAEIWAFEDTR